MGLLATAPLTVLAAPGDVPAKRAAKPQTLKVTSTAFKAHRAIPMELTCDGASTPPPLSWSGVPKAARSLAIFVEDPDAPDGPFLHWLVTGIPPAIRQISNASALPAGALVAKNGKGEQGYTPPCPPSGTHRYVFRVYALDTTIPPPGTKDDFLASIDGHILAQGELIGTYQKAPAAKLDSALKPQ